VTRPRKLATTLTAFVAAFALTACGSGGGGSASGSSSTEPTTIDVTITADSVTPNGERVEVQHGQDVTLVVTADTAGEIHVHSTPEQELAYKAGTTTLTIKDLDQPGVVDVESHALEKVILQLEVK
jgi:hypothetical protein